MFYHAFRSRCVAFFAALATALIATCLPAGIARADSPVTVTTNLTDTASFLSENSVQSINTELRALQRKGLDPTSSWSQIFQEQPLLNGAIQLAPNRAYPVLHWS